MIMKFFKTEFAHFIHCQVSMTYKQQRIVEADSLLLKSLIFDFSTAHDVISK